MKKNILAFVCLMHTIVFANAHAIPAVTPQAKESFNKEFPRALYATWETVDAGLYAVRFVNNNQSVIAYYGEEGNPLGLGRIITPGEILHLPASVQHTLSRICTDCKLISAQEWMLPAARLYYFDIVNNQGAFSVGIDHTGKIQKRKFLQHF